MRESQHTVRPVLRSWVTRKRGQEEMRFFNRPGSFHTNDKWEELRRDRSPWKSSSPTSWLGISVSTEKFRLSLMDLPLQSQYLNLPSTTNDSSLIWRKILRQEVAEPHRNWPLPSFLPPYPAFLRGFQKMLTADSAPCFAGQTITSVNSIHVQLWFSLLHPRAEKGYENEAMHDVMWSIHQTGRPAVPLALMENGRTLLIILAYWSLPLTSIQNEV